MPAPHLKRGAHPGDAQTQLRPVRRLPDGRTAFLWGIRLTLLVAVVTVNFLAFGAQTVQTLGGDKASHLLAFLVLAGLVDLSFPRSDFGLPKILALVAYGLFIECVQYFLPGRFLSLGDFLADVSGIGIYFLLLRIAQRHSLFNQLRKRLSGQGERF